MRHLLSILAALCLLSAPAAAQTMKALMYNTNGVIVYNNTNRLTFSQQIEIEDGLYAYGDFYMVDGATITADGYLGAMGDWTFEGTVNFSFPNLVRPNLGFSTNLNTLWTATNASNARTAIGLGATNSPTFSGVYADDQSIELGRGGLYGYGAVISLEERRIFSGTNDEDWNFDGSDIAGLGAIQFNNTTSSSITRTNLSLGATSIVTFAGLTNNGDITINQTTATNGLLFIRRTNNEPFLGLANLIASNNTTVSNETLFRVGVAEATNRSAQFGFRSTNTNGNGVAVFSVFGFNALMQIGADASTNAVIFSGGGTNNEVMTLIKNGATEFARPIAFSTTAHAAATRTNLALGATSDPTFRDVSVRDLSIVGGSGGKIVYPSTNTAPANTTNVVTWIQVNVGTNAYRVPLYQ